MGCCNNNWGGSNCLWIILILIILFGCGGCGNGCNNGCNNSCDCGCSGCGC